MIRKSAYQAFSIVFLSVFFLPTVISATTTSDLEARIAELLQGIQTLESELNTVKNTTQTSSPLPVTPTPSVQKTTLSFTPFETFLHKGSEGTEVTKLQRFLAQYPEIYPEGTISGYFGTLTESAVKRFQRTYNIVSTGSPTVTGYGLLGIRTRAKLNELIKQNAANAQPVIVPTPIPETTPSSPSSFTTTLGKGSTGAVVTALQQYLAKDSTLYPEGLITGYYGTLTERAIERFQERHNIVTSGTPATTGYGAFGPKTRAKLNEIITGTNTTPSPNPNTSNTAPVVQITVLTTATFGDTVALSASATDDGKPFGTLTVTWSKVDGPGTVTFANAQTANTTAQFSETGTYHLSATVSDGVLSASATAPINIAIAPAPATTTPETTTPPVATSTLIFSANPTTLTKGATTTLTWSTTNVSTCTAGNGWSGTKTASGSTTFTPQTTTTYTLLCTGTSGNTIGKEVTVTVTTPPVSGTLPSPWTLTDIGSPDPLGIASYTSGIFTLKTGGADIWNTADQFSFISQPITGDKEIIARVDSLTNTDPWAKAGVMIRDSLSAGSAHAMMIVTPTSGLSFQRRLIAGDSSSSFDLSSAGAAPKYVRLVRIGTTISAYYGSSATGPWTFTENINVAMTGTDYIGLVTVSGVQSTPTTAVFSNITITTPTATTPAPTLTFSVSPASITAGQSSTLTWSSTDASSCSASDTWSGSKGVSGSSSVTPTQTSTYTLACTGTGGNVTKSVTVIVVAAPPPPENGGVLRVHPTNPRYFTDDSGKAIYMTGSHIWYMIQAGPEEFAPLNPSMSDAEFNAYLDWMQSHGQNFTRLWSAFSYMDYGGPFPWNRSGSGTAYDGGSKFDMTSFNQQYFDLLRRRVLQIQDRGMYASVMFFGSHNGFKSNFSRIAWNPNNNINSALGSAFDPNDGYSFFTTNSAALDIQHALVRKTVDTLNDVDNIIWETMNEPGGTAKAVAWNKAMVQYAHSYEAGKSKQHLVGMTGGWGLGKAMLSSDADWISPDWDDEYTLGGPASYSSKIAIVDTDHLPWSTLYVSDVTTMRKWVWRTFVRGNHPILMDVYNIYNPNYNAYGAIDPAFDPVRDAMGDTRSYSLRFPSLARMIPSETLSDTGYALYENGVAYLVYQPDHYSFTVDLSAGNYIAEWFDPRDASKSTVTVNHGGGSRSFTIPAHISDDAILYLLAQ